MMSLVKHYREMVQLESAAVNRPRPAVPDLVDKGSLGWPGPGQPISATNPRDCQRTCGPEMTIMNSTTIGKRSVRGPTKQARHWTARATGTHYLIRRQARANRPPEKQ